MFSRKNPRRDTEFDLNELVAALEPTLARVLAEPVEVIVQLRPGPAPVCADRGELEQVILNLAVNARDAMPEGGTLTVATRRVEMSAPQADPLGVDPGAYVALTLADTGVGIEDAHFNRLFEPYFTTKPEGEGTGLGLATSYAIVEDSAGAITIASEVGRGTSVTVYLPLSQPASLAPLSPSVPQLGATVLLVEDDGDVRALAKLVLEQAGYAVLEARYGDEALWVADRSDRPIDLVLTDGVLPGMNGRELARRTDRRGVCDQHKGRPPKPLQGQPWRTPATPVLQQSLGRAASRRA